MDLTLTRTDARFSGIFGQMGLWATLEHAYPQGDSDWVAKVPPGVYTCVLGPHKLEGMTREFLTYEVTGVPNCTGILFHWGNWDTDSAGCILLGTKRDGNMVINSKLAFDQFMTLQNGLSTFKLTVI